MLLLLPTILFYAALLRYLLPANKKEWGQKVKTELSFLPPRVNEDDRFFFLSLEIFILGNFLG